MHALKNYLLISFLLFANYLTGQNYQAINGSVYAGSLAAGSNPAAIVHVPFAWDVTPLAFQFKQSTNAYRIDKYSFLSSPANAEAAALNGTKKRFFFANQDIHLLNARVSLNSKAAIAFGANIRSYIFAVTSQANYQDTSYTLADFMKINTGHLPLSGQFTGSAWAEIYATFSHTLIDEGNRILNAGISLKITRALGGGYAKAQDVSYIPAFVGNKPAYQLTNGRLQYGYSYNFDQIDSNKSFNDNRKTFLQKTYSSPGADIGFEYILLSREDREDGGDYAYDTKFGISILDIGSNKYRHGSRSRLATNPLPGLTDTILEHRFSAVTNFDNFNDSMATVVGAFTKLNGNFFIYQPTRLMINADQHIANNFFVNAEITIPLISLASENTLYIKDMNLLAITPRWEVKALGAYLPVLVNTHKQVWMGAAFKAGPLLFGTHNLGGLFSKNKAQSGGLYLALTIRPGKNYDRKAHYPQGKLPATQRRSTECPKF